MKVKGNGLRRAIAALLAALMLLGGATVALAETVSAIVAVDSMKVYSSPSLTGQQGTLVRDTVVRVSAYANDVAKIEYLGLSGFVSLSDIKTVDSVATKAVVTSDAKAYESPSTDAESVKVKSATRVYVLLSSNGWSRVEKDGMVAYIQDEYLTAYEVPDSDSPTDGTGQSSVITVNYTAAAKKDTKVYKSASASSKKLGTLKKGKEVTVTATNDKGWARIELDGNVGFCKLADLTRVEQTPEPTPSAVSASVTVDKLPVYEKADTSSKKLGTLKKGKTVNLISQEGSWAYIELNGHYGYCAAIGLSETSAAPTPEPSTTPDVTQARKGTVTAKILKVYKSASTSSKKLGTLKKGKTVNVIAVQGGWAYIELNGNYGYCKVSGLSVESGEAEPTPTPSTENAVKATVSASSVKVYQTASESGAVLGTLKKGQEVNLISWQDGWAYIELNGRYGFCRLDALSTKAQEIKVPSGYKAGGFTATVVSQDAKVYASDSTDAQSKALSLGEEVTVYAYSAKWALITLSGSHGYVPVKLLSRTAYATIDSDGESLLVLLRALLYQGFYDDVPSTSYNAAAISAIKRFQSACGIEETGVADQTLQRILYSDYAPVSSLLTSTYSSGDTGSNVSRLQARLYALGYLSKTTSLSGQYSATTVSAVKLFQTASGLSASGTADAATLRALYSTEAKKLPSGTKAADATTSGSTSSSTYLDTVPNGLASTTSTYSSGMSNSEKLEYVIYVAQNQLGKPYVYGSTGPNQYDCSGLTTYIFRQIGVSLKRSAYSQGYDESFEKITGWENLRRGDLVFFNTISDSDLSDHVGIYLGDGYFIHASSGGHKVVVSNVTTGYYNRVFSWGRRILK